VKEPDMQISRIRLSDKTSRLHPRPVVPKSAQAYELKRPTGKRHDETRHGARATQECHPDLRPFAEGHPSRLFAKAEGPTRAPRGEELVRLLADPIVKLVATGSAS
jgi:hypothetical protein